MSADEARVIQSANSEIAEAQIPSHLICPLTRELMIDPVGTPYGHFYDRWAIEGWFNAGHTTDPLTKKPLYKKDLITLYPMKEAVESKEYTSIREKIIQERNDETLQKLLSTISIRNEFNQNNPSIIHVRYGDSITCDNYLQGIYVSQKILDKFFFNVSTHEISELNNELSNLNALFCKLNGLNDDLVFPNNILDKKFEEEYKAFKIKLLSLPRKIVYKLLKKWVSSKRILQKIGIPFKNVNDRLICDLEQFAADIGRYAASCDRAAFIKGLCDAMDFSSEINCIFRFPKSKNRFSNSDDRLTVYDIAALDEHIRNLLVKNARHIGTWLVSSNSHSLSFEEFVTLDKGLLEVLLKDKNAENFRTICNRLNINMRHFINDDSIDIDKKIYIITNSKLIEDIFLENTDMKKCSRLKEIAEEQEENWIEELVEACLHPNDDKVDKEKQEIVIIIDDSNSDAVKDKAYNKAEFVNMVLTPKEGNSYSSKLDGAFHFIKAHKKSLSLILGGAGLGIYGGYNCITNETNTRLFYVNAGLTVLGVSLFFIGIAIYRYKNTQNNDEYNQNEIDYTSPSPTPRSRYVAL